MISIDEGETKMSMTGTDRVRALRERRRRRQIQLTVVLHEDDLGEIARRGYAEAATTDVRCSSSWCRNGFGCGSLPG